MPLELCDHHHPEVCWEYDKHRGCPVCEVKDELAEVESAQKEDKERLEFQVEELEELLEELQNE